MVADLGLRRLGFGAKEPGSGILWQGPGAGSGRLGGHIFGPKSGQRHLGGHSLGVTSVVTEGLVLQVLTGLHMGCTGGPHGNRTDARNLFKVSGLGA